MFGLTKQEKRVIIVLIVSFITGLCLKYSDKRDVKAGQAWKDKQNFEINTLLKEASTKKDADKVSTKIHNKTEKLAVLTKKSFVEKININTATSQELQLLPHIGPVLARNIIEYRNRFGSFKTIEEIKKVKKIGKKTFNKIEKSITVK